MLHSFLQLPRSVVIPGNMSILPYYFRDNGASLVMDDSLRADLELTSGGKIWNINLSGRM